MPTFLLFVYFLSFISLDSKFSCRQPGQLIGENPKGLSSTLLSNLESKEIASVLNNLEQAGKHFGGHSLFAGCLFFLN